VANPKSTSHRCYILEVACVWELTKETIDQPLGCLQGGCEESQIGPAASSLTPSVNGAAPPCTYPLATGQEGTVSLSLRLKDLLGPVTRVKKKKGSVLVEEVIDVLGADIEGEVADVDARHPSTPGGNHPQVNPVANRWFLRAGVPPSRAFLQG